MRANAVRCTSHSTKTRHRLPIAATLRLRCTTLLRSEFCAYSHLKRASAEGLSFVHLSETGYASTSESRRRVSMLSKAPSSTAPAGEAAYREALLRRLPFRQTAAIFTKNTVFILSRILDERQPTAVVRWRKRSSRPRRCLSCQLNG